MFFPTSCAASTPGRAVTYESLEPQEEYWSLWGMKKLAPVLSSCINAANNFEIWLLKTWKTVSLRYLVCCRHLSTVVGFSSVRTGNAWVSGCLPWLLLPGPFIAPPCPLATARRHKLLGHTCVGNLSSWSQNHLQIPFVRLSCQGLNGRIREPVFPCSIGNCQLKHIVNRFHLAACRRWKLNGRIGWHRVLVVIRGVEVVCCEESLDKKTGVLAARRPRDSQSSRKRHNILPHAFWSGTFEMAIFEPCKPIDPVQTLLYLRPSSPVYILRLPASKFTANLCSVI